MRFSAIVTVGPSILERQKLEKIHSYGDCIYRINGAHSDATNVTHLVKQIKDVIADAKIMVDLPGNKVRTSNLCEPIRLVKGECLKLYDYQINYSSFYSYLKKGDIVRANDSIFTLEVVDVKDKVINMLSYSDGLLLANKGLHVRGVHQNIPFLFEKDHQLIRVAKELEIDYLAISFVRNAADVREVKKKLVESNIKVLAKIETLSAVQQLKYILQEVESILIDRGDLSTEIDILELASVQDSILKESLALGKNVYLATQFLKNMEINPVPLIPEVIDLCKTVKSGIAGIQLSEETAIGKYPLECVKLLFDAYKANVK